MRIGLFTDTYPPYINGVSTSVYMLKKALEKKGHQVYVVAVSNSVTKYEFEEDSHIVRIPGVPTGIYDYRLSRVYPIKVINTIRNWKLDVIHSHTEFGVGTFARLFAKQFNIPLVHTYHTMYEDYIHYITKGYFNRSSKEIVKHLTLFYCDKTATELIVPTKKTYDLFKEKYKVERNVHIIPTGIEVERFYVENIDKKRVRALRKYFKLDKNDFVIIFVGRLAAEKNVEFLLEAERDLYKNGHNIKLLIVGDGPDKEKYEQLAEKYEISSQVIFTGKVAWEEIPCYYQLANLFSTASTTETQGLTVVEAMAGGVSPVCIDDEAFRTVVVDGLNGRLFHDKKEFKQQVLELYQNETLRKQYAKQARIQAEHCSSSHYAERVLEVYERAIKSKQESMGWLAKIFKKIKGD